MIWEEDPIGHREVAKKISPAFSKRSMRAMEPVVHKYMDYFVDRIKELGADPQGVGMNQWMNWLAWNIAADLSWNSEAHEMRDSKSSQHFSVCSTLKYGLRQSEKFN
jgi:cytochrome P450